MARKNAQSDREHSKARYWWYVDRGLCPQCGITYAEPGHVRCKRCMLMGAAYLKRLDPDGSRHSEYVKALRADCKARGVCADCEKPVEEGHTYCERCRARRAENNRIFRMRKRLKREAEKERAKANGG